MTWHRVDVGYFRNRKVRRLSHRAQVLDLAAILYANTELTDGVIADEVLGLVLEEARATKRQVAELVSGGRWEVTANGYQLHHFVESGINPSAEKVKLKLKRQAESMAELRAARQGQPNA